MKLLIVFFRVKDFFKRLDGAVFPIHKNYFWFIEMEYQKLPNKFFSFVYIKLRANPSYQYKDYPSKE